MERNVVYTVITNKYDKIKEPRVVSEGWDYVLLTDHPCESDVWDVRETSSDNRYLKILAPGFDGLTLYVDGSIEIIGDLNEFIKEVPTWFTLWRHPHRGCTYNEARAVVQLKGCDDMTVHKQMIRYMEDGFPRNFGLGANGVMLRDLSDEAVKDICRQWWNEFERGVKRDQLSLMYTFWKNGYSPAMFDNDIFNRYFIWKSHRK